MLRVLLQCGDAYFVKAFSDYASAYCPNIEFVCFTVPDKAVDFLSSTMLRLDAVLATQPVLEQITQSHIMKLLVSERTAFSNLDQIQINIYQSGPAIISDIKNALALSGNHLINRIEDREVRVVATYSVQGGGGKSTLGYALAVTAARSGSPTLYLNLEPFPAFGQLYDHHFSRSIDDLLFELKSDRDPAPVLLDTMERNRDQVYVFPSFSFAGNLLSLSQDNLNVWMKTLMEKTDLEYIILDLSVGFHPLNLWALELATSILQVYSDDVTGREHLHRTEEDVYFKNLPIQGNFLTVLNKCRQKTNEENIAVKMPFSESLQQGKRVADVLERNPAFYTKCKELLGRIT
mgnify:CR=1 FL=1